MLDHYRTPFALSEQPLTTIAKNSYGKRDFAKAEGGKTGNGEGDTLRPTGGGGGGYVGSCCVPVGSGVQTDATTPCNVGTCSASWEGYDL